MVLPQNSPEYAVQKPSFDEAALGSLLLEKGSIIDKKSAVIQSQKNRITILEELLQLHKQKRFAAVEF